MIVRTVKGPPVTGVVLEHQAGGRLLVDWHDGLTTSILDQLVRELEPATPEPGENTMPDTATRTSIVHLFALGSEEQPLCGLRTAPLHLTRELDAINCSQCSQEARRLRSLGAIVGDGTTALAAAPKPAASAVTAIVARIALEGGEIVERLVPTCQCGVPVVDLEAHRQFHEGLVEAFARAAGKRRR